MFDLLLPFQPASIERWKQQSVHPLTEAGSKPWSNHDLHRRLVAWEPPGPALADGPFARLAAAIRRYDIFPAAVGRGVLDRPVEVGDTVGLRYHLCPLLHIHFASRVSEVFHRTGEGREESGFTYRTLQEHPEVGEETFQVSKDLRSGVLEVSLRAWSHLAPGPLVLVKPVCRWLQVAAGRAALDHLEALARA